MVSSTLNGRVSSASLFVDTCGGAGIFHIQNLACLSFTVLYIEHAKTKTKYGTKI